MKIKDLQKKKKKEKETEITKSLITYFETVL